MRFSVFRKLWYLFNNLSAIAESDYRGRDTPRVNDDIQLLAETKYVVFLPVFNYLRRCAQNSDTNDQPCLDVLIILAAATFPFVSKTDRRIIR